MGPLRHGEVWDPPGHTAALHSPSTGPARVPAGKEPAPVTAALCCSREPPAGPAGPGCVSTSDSVSLYGPRSPDSLLTLPRFPRGVPAGPTALRAESHSRGDRESAPASRRSVGRTRLSAELGACSARFPVGRRGSAVAARRGTRTLHPAALPPAVSGQTGAAACAWACRWEL